MRTGADRSVEAETRGVQVDEREGIELSSLVSGACPCWAASRGEEILLYPYPSFDVVG